jgi:hypothetical protein
MPLFVNPFGKNDAADFSNTLIPLSEAHLHARHAKREVKIGKTSTAKKGDAEKGGARQSGEFEKYTVDSMRSEIDDELQAGGVGTVYDRM